MSYSKGRKHVNVGGGGRSQAAFEMLLEMEGIVVNLC
jgi:hypothetical protein